MMRQRMAKRKRTKGRTLEASMEDPCFNLALEHAILELQHTTAYPVSLRFWRDPKAVIIGRGQALQKEVNIEYCRRNNISICRRISGGGAVYHDKGNLNISFFLSNEYVSKFIDLKHLKRFFTDVLYTTLAQVGVTDLEKEGGSNILHNGKKVSGSAGYRKQDTTLYHATLLLSANLSHLKKSLKARSRDRMTITGSRFFPTGNIGNFNTASWKALVKRKLEQIFHLDLVNVPTLEREKHFARKLYEEIYSKRKWLIDKQRELVNPEMLLQT